MVHFVFDFFFQFCFAYCYPFQPHPADGMITNTLLTLRTRGLRTCFDYFSLFLELCDATLPLVGTVFTKFSNVIMFFAVYLVARLRAKLIFQLRTRYGRMQHSTPLCVC